MKFAAVIEYTADKALTEQHRPAHREYLKGLLAAGKLVGSGPFTDAPGALIIYEADTPEAAEAILRADPFHAAGVFVRWQLRPWNMLFANPALMPTTTP